MKKLMIMVAAIVLSVELQASIPDKTSGKYVPRNRKQERKDRQEFSYDPFKDTCKGLIKLRPIGKNNSDQPKSNQI